MSADVAFGTVTQVSPLLVQIDGDEGAVRVSRRTATVSVGSKVVLLGRTVAGASVWTAMPWVAA
jgi:hypothetical protein